LRRRVEGLGVHVHTGRETRAIEGDRDGPTRLVFDGHDPLPADLVVFSAGIRPRDQLARDAGLEIGPRGGVEVDDHLRTSDSAIFAVGECASVSGRVYGLVAPGYQMARVAAAHLMADHDAGPTPVQAFAGADLSTKLKLLGVEVACVGDPHGDGERHPLVWDDPVGGV
jgi:nitrite reductase (NADH) large subunit